MNALLWALAGFYAATFAYLGWEITQAMPDPDEEER